MVHFSLNLLLLALDGTQDVSPPLESERLSLGDGESSVKLSMHRKFDVSNYSEYSKLTDENTKKCTNTVVLRPSSALPT